MGRGRGKGKKPTVVASQEDPGSGEDEKIPSYGRIGRPKKPLKDDVEVEKAAEKPEEDGDNPNGSISIKDGDAPNGSISIKDTENVVGSAKGRKRKMSTQAKDIIDTEKHENGTELKSNTNDSAKFVGFRQIGSRRKNKPRRAAEAGIIYGS